MVQSLLIIGGIISVLIAIWLLWKLRQAERDSLVESREQAVQVQLPLSRREQTAITVQNVFDETRILTDLVSLADQPSAVARYVERWKKRSLTTGQIDLLNQWDRLYNSAANTIEAKTKLRRAQREYQQLEAEDEISRREKDVRLAELEAQKEEALLRGEEVRHKRGHLQDTHPAKGEYEQQMDAAWEKEKVNLLWEIRQRQGKRIANQEALTHWFNDELNRILRNARLAPEQQAELVRELHKEYDAEKEKAKRGFADPDETDPEENLFAN